ncbi:Transcription factor TFIIE, alpha subunit [Methanohalobium evestigatum Z-7303]|uniref:Transcription factor E n=1 Tax=Methanohalobium evestigatum (strain ATCC BAA-1072 / DSM 3721 / NBRC 107634 / OCM 161 / Z-7303) TaxID=644295 RepID=D7E7Z2_METEZ|nr:transcription factor [Methanohalobium evestigatum]ADI73334.1 Transcription factor TFIIE, alpha subunit [Methanohalobium evestigatum Z-7303]
MVDLNDPVIRGYLKQLVGDEGLKMIENMPEGEVTDEKIAEETGVLLNIVRRTLFILNEYKLVVCRRERDTSSGWLTYLWRLDLSGIETRLEKERKKLIQNLEQRLEFEEGNVFFECPEGCLRLLFNEATNYHFLCPLCGEDLVAQDNSKTIENIRSRLNKLKKCG